MANFNTMDEISKEIKDAASYIVDSFLRLPHGCADQNQFHQAFLSVKHKHEENENFFGRDYETAFMHYGTTRQAINPNTEAWEERTPFLKLGIVNLEIREVYKEIHIVDEKDFPKGEDDMNNLVERLRNNPNNLKENMIADKLEFLYEQYEYAWRKIREFTQLDGYLKLYEMWDGEGIDSILDNINGNIVGPENPLNNLDDGVDEHDKLVDLMSKLKEVRDETFDLLEAIVQPHYQNRMPRRKIRSRRRN